MKCNFDLRQKKSKDSLIKEIERRNNQELVLIQKQNPVERETSTVIFHESEPVKEEKPPVEAASTFEISNISKQVAVTLENKHVAMRRVKRNKILRELTVEHVFVNKFSKCEELPYFTHVLCKNVLGREIELDSTSHVHENNIVQFQLQETSEFKGK